MHLYSLCQTWVNLKTHTLSGAGGGGLAQGLAILLLSWQSAAPIDLSPFTKVSTRPSFDEAYLGSPRSTNAAVLAPHFCVSIGGGGLRHRGAGGGGGGSSRTGPGRPSGAPTHPSTRSAPASAPTTSYRGGGGGQLRVGAISFGETFRGGNFRHPCTSQGLRCLTHPLHCQRPRISPGEIFATLLEDGIPHKIIPPPLCDILSGCCSFTGPWTVTRSSLRMLRRVAAFCRPLRPVLLLVSFPRSRSPVVGVLGLC